MRSRKAQGWTIDYVVSFLIFTIALILAVKVLTNTFQNTDFDDIVRDSITISEHLLTEGYPSDWNENDVIRIGLTSSKNRLDQGKVNNYLKLNYNVTKTRFGINRDYIFYFENNNNTIIGMGEECALGSDEVLETKVTYKEMRPSAYYYKDESLMAGWMTLIGATYYDGNNDNDVDDFYTNLGNYEFVMMENPELSNGGTISNSAKKSAIQNFVNSGGYLFLSEDVSLNFTGVEFAESIEFNGQVVNDEDEYLILTLGSNLVDNDLLDQSFKVNDISSSSFTVIANYTTDGAWIARWNYGMGTVYYFATINAMNGVTNFRDKVGPAARDYVNATKVNCTSINVNGISTENLARTERLVVYDSEIHKMVVVTWS